MLQKSILAYCGESRVSYFFAFIPRLLSSLVQVNDCETESGLCSATLSHAAPSSQGMAKVQDGHTNACDRYTALHVTLTLVLSQHKDDIPHFKNACGYLSFYL